MCGIVGIISKRAYGFFQGDADMLENLLLLDFIRGKHSTGVFGVHNNNQVSVAKIASHPLDLFVCKDWSNFRGKMSKSMHMVIGHNRRATGGAITSENAHPFVENNIVLVHNGVINSGVETDNKEIDVDSHMVCEAFAKSNYEEVVKKIKGAFAFVWYDTKTRTLHTLRNSERPLYILETEENYYLASEAWMVQGLLSRETQTTRNKIESCVMTEVGQLYSFQKNKPYTKVAVELAKETTYEDYPRVRVTGRWVAGQFIEDRTKPIPFVKPGQETPRLLTNTTGNSTTGADNDGVFTFPKKNTRDEFYRELHSISGMAGPIIGQRVLFRVMSIAHINQGRYRVIGKVCSTAHAKTDVSFITRDVDVFTDKDVEVFEGTINVLVWMTNGPSAEMSNVSQVTFVDLHHSKVPAIEWRYLLNNGKCKDCESSCLLSKQHVTKVRWNKEKNQWDITCHLCIAKKMQSGTVRDFFLQKAGLVDEPSDDGVQDGVAECSIIIDNDTGAVTTTGEAASQLH